MYQHYSFVCAVCGCSTLGSLPEGCDASGRCLCKAEFQGPRCEQCRSGFHSFPNCQGVSLFFSFTFSLSHTHTHTLPDEVLPRSVFMTLLTAVKIHQQLSERALIAANANNAAIPLSAFSHIPECTCDPRTSLDISCTASGHCNCRPNYGSASCDQCAPGYYGFPSCTGTGQDAASGTVRLASAAAVVDDDGVVVVLLQPVSAPLKAPATAAVTSRADSVCVCLAWRDSGATLAHMAPTASPAAEVNTATFLFTYY